MLCRIELHTEDRPGRWTGYCAGCEAAERGLATVGKSCDRRGAFGKADVQFACKQRDVQKLSGIQSETVHNFGCRDETGTIAFLEIMSVNIILPVGYVEFYDAEQRKLMTILPASDEDLYLLLDLLASFRHLVASANGTALPPIVVNRTRRTDASKRTSGGF